MLQLAPHPSLAHLPYTDALLTERRKRLKIKRCKSEIGRTISREDQRRLDDLCAELECTEDTQPNMWRLVELENPL